MAPADFSLSPSLPFQSCPNVQSPASAASCRHGEAPACPGTSKAQDENKRNPTTQNQKENLLPSPLPLLALEAAPVFGPSLIQFHVGGPGPPSSPSTSSSSLSSPRPRDGMVTICPTFVTRRKDRTAFVALSSLKSKAIRGALGCFHPQRFPSSFQSSKRGGGGSATHPGRTRRTSRTEL